MNGAWVSKEELVVLEGLVILFGLVGVVGLVGVPLHDEAGGILVVDAGDRGLPGIEATLEQQGVAPMACSAHIDPTFTMAPP